MSIRLIDFSINTFLLVFQNWIKKSVVQTRTALVSCLFETSNFINFVFETFTTTKESKTVLQQAIHIPNNIRPVQQLSIPSVENDYDSRQNVRGRQKNNSINHY